MIITVISVRMMQMTIHQIVYMISVWNLFMAAVWTVNMIWIVSSTSVVWRARTGVCRSDLDSMFVDVIAMGMMEMSIVKIVHMVSVLNRRMATSWTVNVFMLRMGLTGLV